MFSWPLCRVVELTGDVTPDMRAIAKADLIVTTPEKWDGVSRSWQNRSYVQKVAILIIDEIHLLGKRLQQPSEICTLFAYIIGNYDLSIIIKYRSILKLLFLSEIIEKVVFLLNNF